MRENFIIKLYQNAKSSDIYLITSYTVKTKYLLFQYYLTYSNLIVNGVGPLLLLLALNIKIYSILIKNILFWIKDVQPCGLHSPERCSLAFLVFLQHFTKSQEGLVCQTFLAATLKVLLRTICPLSQKTITGKS